MRRLILLAALALGAGCAHTQATSSAPVTPAGAGPGGQYSFQSSQGAYTVQVSPSQITGPNYQVTRYPGGFRGQIDNRVIDISWDQDSVHGTLGNEPVTLKVTSEGGGTRVQGSWGGTLSNVLLTPQGLNGRMGNCDYSMGGMPGDVLSGQSTCSSAPPTNTVIQLPQGMTPPLSGQAAAILAMLLGQ